MTDFPGIVGARSASLSFAGRVSIAYKRPRPTFAPAFSNSGALTPPDYAGGRIAGNLTITLPGSSVQGHFRSAFNASEHWFERPHVLDRSYAFGNIVATITERMEVFNGYRRASLNLTALVNNAGQGVEPDFTPPETIARLGSLLDPSSTNTVPVGRELVVTTQGVPRFDTTLDFTFSDGRTIQIPISGDRVAFFPIEFNGDGTVTETLVFGTDQIEALDGSKQLISYRKNPRQQIRGPILVTDRSRREVDALLFGWQSKSFGVGVWFERNYTTAAVSAGASVIPVSTAWTDLRVGQLVAIVTNSRVYDIAAIASFNSTTITLTSTLLNSYPVRTTVVPVRVARLGQTVSGKRYAPSVSEWMLDFLVDSNDVDASFASAAAFNTHAGIPLLDDLQVMRDGGGTDVSMTTRLRIIDNESGVVYQATDWPLARRTHAKGFRVSTRQQLYELRRLLYYLRGNQKAFWLPTFAEELVPTQTMTIGTNVLTVDRVGYAQFVRHQAPRNVIRITFVDGTRLIRTVTNSEQLSATEERLTLDATWPSTRPASDVTRVEYLERSRLASNEVVIEHLGIGIARVFVPVETSTA